MLLLMNINASWWGGMAGKQQDEHATDPRWCNRWPNCEQMGMAIARLFAVEDKGSQMGTDVDAPLDRQYAQR